MIQDERIRKLNLAPVRKGAYVLYWMQASQRLRCNHALTHAVHLANELNLPVLIGFGLADGYPEANERHFAFMVEGLREVGLQARKHGLGFAVLKGSPDETMVTLAEEAAAVVVDRGYLRLERSWRDQVAKRVGCRVIEVESEVVVPVEMVSQKEEYAARTIRPKVQRLLPMYLVPFVETRPKVRFKADITCTIDLEDVEAVFSEMSIDRSVPRVMQHIGGEKEGARRIRSFVLEKLADYCGDRNDPNLDGVSNLSPYLHFGQISALDIALQVGEALSEKNSEGAKVFLEELIIRRELSVNFCTYQPAYDRYESLPEWARLTLDRHRDDSRPYVYSRDEFERAETRDPYWNAAQVEMVATGKMHNYMRMYWGKKIIEWSAAPEEAYETALYLNNKYELDGGDVNSFAGVAWCFGKHDRPWREREIFGTVRYMNESGLKRKFDRDAYVDKIEKLSGRLIWDQTSLR